MLIRIQSLITSLIPSAVKFGLVLVLVLVFAFTVKTIWANWTAPPQAPPGCPSSEPACNAPINVSGNLQTKGSSTTVTTPYLFRLLNNADDFLRFERNLATNPTTFRLGTDNALVINNSNIDTMTLKGGNVGIGTTPGTKLDVKGGIIRVQDSAFSLYDTTDVKTWNLAYDNGGDYLYLDEFGLGRRFVIKNGGNVGIGTTNPPSHAALTIGKTGTGDGTTFNGVYSNIQSTGPHTYLTAFNAALRANGSISVTNAYGLYVTAPVLTGGAAISNKYAIVTESGAGNVGIGITNPGAKLEVAGQIKITGGSPGANKFLSSDAAGLASWQDLPAGALQNLFETMNAPAGTDPVADTPTDILNFAAGAGISITGDSSTDTLTFTNTGDTNTGDDITSITETFPIDVTGAAPTYNIALTNTCGANQILKWNGAAWSCAADDAGGAGFWAAGGDNIYNTNTGNVGIGTTTPGLGGGGAKLDVAGGKIRVQNSSFSLYNTTSDKTWDLGNDGELFYINEVGAGRRFAIANGGNVGIGNFTKLSPPYYKLHVKGGVADSNLAQIENSDIVNGGGLQIFIANSDPAGEAFDVYTREGLTYKHRFLVRNDGKVGIGMENPASLFSVGPNSEFRVNNEGNLTQIRNIFYSWPNAQGGASTFLQNDGSGNLSWAAGGDGGGFWTQSGSNLYPNNTRWNVGIGTTSPQGLLHVSNPGGALPRTWAYFDLNVGGTNPEPVVGPMLGWNRSSGAGESLLAYRSDLAGGAPRLSLAEFDGTNFYERMTIKAGNVGIGITNPPEKLTVSNTGDVGIFAYANAARANARLFLARGTEDKDKAMVYFGKNGSYLWHAGLPYNCGAVTTGFVISRSDYTHNCTAPRNPEFIITAGGNVGIGTTSPAQKLHVADGHLRVDGAIVAPEGTLRDDNGGWVRTYGNTGWYSETHGGGWFMQDSTWIRAYNNKDVYTGGIIRGNEDVKAGNVSVCREDSTNCPVCVQ